MPHSMNKGRSGVADLFRMRHAQRTGELTDMDPELSSYGESLGIGPLGGESQPAMPGKPVTGPAGPEVPAGDSMSAMAPPGGGAPTGETHAMTARSNPASPGGGVMPRQKMGIPALDALSEMPKKRSRGLVHDRKLGRVLKVGN